MENERRQREEAQPGLERKTLGYGGEQEGRTEILWSDSDKFKYENDAERGVGVRKVFYVQGI